MNSFATVLEKAINRKSKTRAKFEETVATWSLNGWLEDTEVTSLLALLDTVFGTAE